MELIQLREKSSDISTISKLFQDGVKLCYICEDVVRETYSGKWVWKPEYKVPGKTAIPHGRYKIVMDLSNRFQQIMPHLLDVPDFQGIRIHPGNTAADTEGCLLPGKLQSGHTVLNSRQAYEELFNLLSNYWNKDEEMFINIVNDWIPA